MKRKIIVSILAIIMLFVVAGCTVTRTEPFIDSIKQEPNIIRENMDFTLLYQIVNPSDKSDELYLEFIIPEDEDCLQFRNNRYTNTKRVSLGEIDAHVRKSFYTEFRAQDNTEGQSCTLEWILYPSENSDTPIYTLTTQVNIAQGTN